MIEHIRSYLGYCGQCGQPAFVGEFSLRGWKHLFSICNVCMQKLTGAVSEK